jgi:hypothetical protein
MLHCATDDDGFRSVMLLRPSALALVMSDKQAVHQRQDESYLRSCLPAFVYHVDWSDVHTRCSLTVGLLTYAGTPCTLMV